MPAIRYKKYPLADRDTPWDGPREVREADVDDLKVMCTWYEEPGDLKGHYKLPHHRQRDKYTVWRGVANAMARLFQARTQIPASDRRGVYNHLSRHYEDFDEEPPEFREYTLAELRELFPEEFLDDEEITIQSENIAKASLRATLQETEELQEALDVINAKFALKPLSPEEVFIFQAELSNQHIDWYGTRMTPTTLKNYLADAQAGVPLMNSHRSGSLLQDPELPLGRSYEAVLSGKPVQLSLDRASSTPAPLVPSEAGQRLNVAFYIARGLRLGEVPTDQAIRGIETGIITDMSIGFRPGQYICSICGENYIGTDCPHVALVEYEEGMCFAWVDNGRLIEGSLVYSGATPGAMIRKAQALAPQLSKPDVAMLEDRYQTRLLPTSYHTVPSQPPTNPESASAALTDSAVETTKSGQDDDSAIEKLLREQDIQVTFLEEQIESLKKQIADLEPRAARGDAYLKNLIAQAVKSRVRAQGNTFDAQKYREALEENGDVEFIQSEIEAYENHFKAQFQPGRQVKPPEESKGKQAETYLYRV